MTPGLIETLMRADAGQRLFARGSDWVTAGDVRAMAAHVLARVQGVDGPIFLHTHSASRFVAGIVAGAAAGKDIALPAHAQPSYLAELGCPPDAFITDGAFDGAADSGLDIKNADPQLVLFTSGSTSTPKRVAKNLSRLEIEARALESLWAGETGHVVATVSHQHIYGMLFRIFWPLMSGRTSDDIAATYWEDLEGRLAGAALISSPAHLTRLPPRAELFAPPPALIFSSGQLLDAKSAQACIAAFGLPVTEVLGSTETGGIAWRRQTTPDSAWTPFPTVAVTAGAESALIVRSPYLQDDAPLDTGDVVELTGDGGFYLRPRGDRVAKIDGKRISLTRVETMLAELPEIEAAAALTLPDRRDALAAVVVLTNAGQQALEALGPFRLTRRLRTALATTLEPPERPKHWRFVDSVPTDSQGKRVLSTLRTLFDAGDPLAPLVIDVRAQTDTEAELAFTLPPELIFFQGHFDNQAILPGVAQAHMAMLIAQKLWGTWPPDANLERLKFRRVLVPGNAVVLKLKRNAEGRVTFAYIFGDIRASEGEIGGAKR